MTVYSLAMCEMKYLLQAIHFITINHQENGGRYLSVSLGLLVHHSVEGEVQRLQIGVNQLCLHLNAVQ